MTAKRTWLGGVAAIALAIIVAPAARSQAVDSNCADLSSETKRDDILIARTWLPMQIAIETMHRACKTHDFLVNLFSKESDPEKVTADDVFEAEKPAGADGGDAAFRAQLRKQPSVAGSPGWNPAPSAHYIVVPPINPDGAPSLFQPNSPLNGAEPKSAAEIEGSGTLLTPEGLKRGNFADGKLDGIGEEIDPDGVWRGGTYEAGTNVGNMFEVRTIGGKTYLAAGSTVNGKLDGMVERIYADGSRQFEEWENGQL
ncbi:MAG TPA: hypothetical protein VK474_11165, partial [Chthoniobacterales bacterium]|nr:hypothetical protein [Chthoniobacterales bacterium]